MQTEKTVTPIQRGATVDMQTGEAQVPTRGGGTVTEPHQEGDFSYIFNGSPASNKLIETLIQRNGLRAEAAAAKGQTYAPGFMGRVKGEFSTSVTPGRLIALTIVGIGLFYFTKWGAKKLAELAGWNWFGNVVAPPLEEMEVEQPRRAPPPRRQSPAPAPFQAPAQA